MRKIKKIERIIQYQMKIIQNYINVNISLNIAFLKYYLDNAHIFVLLLGNLFKYNFKFRKLLINSKLFIKLRYILGFKFILAGRFTRATKAKSKLFKFGLFSLNSFSLLLDHASNAISSSNGLIGLKLFVLYPPQSSFYLRSFLTRKVETPTGQL